MNVKPLFATAPLVLLAGCGAVNNAINNSIPPVNNAFGLENKSIKITVPTRSRALVTAKGEVSGTFNDANIPSLNLVGSAKVQLAFGASVVVTVPSGASLPASFSLTNFKAGVKVSDTGRLVDLTGNATSATLTFTLISGAGTTTGTYQLSVGGSIGVSDITVSNVSGLLNILTTPGSDSSATNQVIGGIEASVDDTVLPTGSTITFQCSNGDAKLGV